MSCSSFSQIPAPPTTHASCAVPVGGSNSTILDTCCNGHINAIATYNSTGRSDDGCFQFCVTDNPKNVQACLFDSLGKLDGRASGPMFDCFNVDNVVASQNEDGSYNNAGARFSMDGMRWKIRVALGLGLAGAFLGSL